MVPDNYWFGMKTIYVLDKPSYVFDDLVTRTSFMWVNSNMAMDSYNL